MTSGQPPVVAAWLLERFCTDPGLLGDMTEKFRDGRSAGWYWKQAVMAVSVYPISQILQHKWLTVRAIVTGYVIWYIFNETLLRGVLRPWMGGMETAALRAMYFVLVFSLWAANGWVIAKLHRPYSTAMVVAFMIWSIARSVAPLYASVMSAVDGSSGAASLAWDVTMRVSVLLFLMTGGVLCTYREQLRQIRTGGQDWQQGSPRALAAR